MKYKIKAKLWLWGGGEKGSWHFLTVDPEVSRKIASRFSGLKKGFGSLPVKVFFQHPDFKNKKIILETSIFPSSKGQSQKVYLLPVKKKIRNEIGIQTGDVVDFDLEIKK